MLLNGLVGVYNQRKIELENPRVGRVSPDVGVILNKLRALKRIQKLVYAVYGLVRVIGGRIVGIDVAQKQAAGQLEIVFLVLAVGGANHPQIVEPNVLLLHQLLLYVDKQVYPIRFGFCQTFQTRYFRRNRLHLLLVLLKLIYAALNCGCLFGKVRYKRRVRGYSLRNEKKRRNGCNCQ